MANPSVTYTFSNSTTADATQVNQNFTDLINSLIDGTKTLTIATVACATLSLTNPLAISSGGTGASSLGAGALSSNGSAVSSGTLSIANGGTGQASLASGALSSNGSAVSSGTLSLANGGTGTTSFVSNAIPFLNGTSNMTSSATLTYNGGTGVFNLSPSTDVTHLITNAYSAAGNPTLQIQNTATATGSDAAAAISIVKGSGTSSSSQNFILFNINGGSSGAGKISGNGSGSAAFASFSDSRLKKNIEVLSPQLEKIMALRPVEFDYLSGGHQIGFIAQDISQVYPDSVNEDSGGGTKGMLTLVGWDKTSARLVRAIQELAAQNADLLARISALEAKP